jgi:hypothetical protein
MTTTRPRVYERIVVDPPADANQGPTRVRSPEDVAEMRRLRDARVPVPTIAKRFEISIRTAYRYLGDESSVITVTAGVWTARFAVDGTRVPRQLTRWEKA